MNESKCERCGRCCMALPQWSKMADLERALIRQYDRGAEETFKGVVGTRCPNLVFKGKVAKCKIYDKRHNFCRAFNCGGIKW